jgi:hypothetical protein
MGSGHGFNVEFLCFRVFILWPMITLRRQAPHVRRRCPLVLLCAALVIYIALIYIDPVCIALSAVALVRSCSLLSPSPREMTSDVNRLLFETRPAGKSPPLHCLDGPALLLLALTPRHSPPRCRPAAAGPGDRIPGEAGRVRRRRRQVLTDAQAQAIVLTRAAPDRTYAP